MFQVESWIYMSVTAIVEVYFLHEELFKNIFVYPGVNLVNTV